jgi:(p)ppGpp synthase/HD superfamily hydrolase
MGILKGKPEDNPGIDEAIKYLVREVERYCNNKKPLLTHCIRVAFRLDFYGYNKEVVQAALLHDLLEDTKASIRDIEKSFGKKVSELVKVSTFDQKITSKEERYKANFAQASEYGSEALVIRASDLLDNSYYYTFALDKTVYDHLVKKLAYFLRIAKPKIGQEGIYKELKKRLTVLKK